MSDPEGDRTDDVDTGRDGRQADGGAPAPRAAGPLAPIRPRRQAPALAQPGRQGPRGLQGAGPADPGPGPGEAPRRRREEQRWDASLCRASERRAPRRAGGPADVVDAGRRRADGTGPRDRRSRRGPIADGRRRPTRIATRSGRSCTT